MVLDILLIVVLSTVALCQVLGRPFKANITITHDYPQVVDKAVDNPQDKLDDEKIISMDDAVMAINSIIGVDMNEE